MAKYRLVDWEDNRYHDSYGKLLYFDTETQKIHQIEHWSTAYPGGPDMSEFLMPTAEIVEQAQKILADFYFERASSMYADMVFRVRPSELVQGDVVILKSNFNGRKQGKLAKGTKVEVVRVALSQFAPNRYKNGPERTDYNVQVRDAEGKTYWLNIDKIMREMSVIPTEAETMAKAIDMAKGCQFQDMYRCAWLSNNWAADVYQSKAG